MSFNVTKLAYIVKNYLAPYSVRIGELMKCPIIEKKPFFSICSLKFGHRVYLKVHLVSKFYKCFLCH